MAEDQPAVPAVPAGVPAAAPAPAPAAPAPAAPSRTVDVLLMDGRRAQLRRGTGHDALAARRLARTEDESQMALIAVLATIDGRPPLLEDVIDLDLADLGVLQEALGRVTSPGNGASAPSTSSTS